MNFSERYSIIQAYILMPTNKVTSGNAAYIPFILSDILFGFFKQCSPVYETKPKGYAHLFSVSFI